MQRYALFASPAKLFGSFFILGVTFFATRCGSAGREVAFFGGRGRTAGYRGGTGRGYCARKGAEGPGCGGGTAGEWAVKVREGVFGGKRRGGMNTFMQKNKSIYEKGMRQAHPSS